MIKNILTVLTISGLLVACAQEENQSQVTPEKPAVVVPEKQPEVKPEPPKVETKPQLNNNCVTKDKNGNCPPLPNSPRPTPKK